MPMTLSTPEGYFREKKADFFDFAYCGEKNDAAFAKHRNEMNAWWNEHFPQQPVTCLGPSEYSGWLLGGPSISATPVDEVVRKAFLKRWAFNSSPWRLVEHRYADWLAAVRSCEVIAAPLQARRSARYWRLPEGPLLLGENDSGHLLSVQDAKWWFTHDMPGHKADQRTGMVSGGYYFSQSPNDGKTCHSVSIDWVGIDELMAVESLEDDPEFTAWLRLTLSIPEDEYLMITTEP